MRKRRKINKSGKFYQRKNITRVTQFFHFFVCLSLKAFHCWFFSALCSFFRFLYEKSLYIVIYSHGIESRNVQWQQQSKCEMLVNHNRICESFFCVHREIFITSNWIISCSSPDWRVFFVLKFASKIPQKPTKWYWNCAICINLHEI